VFSSQSGRRAAIASGADGLPEGHNELAQEAQDGISATTVAWVWKPVIAELCGTAAHYSLMYFKARTGLMLSSQPYQALQAALSELAGREVHPLVPWLLSFANGMAVLGFAFGRLYRHIPGRSGIVKGLVFGMAGWLVMNLAFLPLIGLGPFGSATGLGIQPALFTFAMMQTYSLVMGQVYAVLTTHAS
jgi:hypothetical protein